MNQDGNAVSMAGQDNNDCTEPAKTPKERLEELETTIRQGMESFMTVGTAICEIREKKLWRQRNYSSFEDYFKSEFKISKAHGYRLMNHAKICKQLGVSPSEVPEKVVRPLSAIKDESALRQVWKAATADSNGDRPSGSIVKEKVKEYKRQTQTEQEQAALDSKKTAAAEQIIDVDADHAAKMDSASDKPIPLEDVVTLGQWCGLSEQKREQLQKLFTQSLKVKQENAAAHLIAFEQANNLLLLLKDNRKALSQVQIEVGMEEVKCRLVQYIVSMPAEEAE